MGPTIVLIVFILLLIAAAFWYLPKARRKMREERERRLKVAQGIFDDEEAGKKKKRRKKRGFNWLSPAIELPSQLRKELAENVPAMVDMVLREHHATSQAASEVVEWINQVNTLNEQYNAGSRLSTADQSADNLETWMAQSIDLLRQKREAQRTCLAKFEEFQKHNQKLAGALDRLGIWLKLLDRDRYDLENLEPELARILELARLVEDEVNVHPAQFNDMPDSLPEAAEETDAEIEAAVSKAFEKCLKLLETVVLVSADKAVVRQAVAELDKIEQDNELLEPEKPAEEEVAVFVEDACEWARSLQDAQIAVGNALDKLEPSIGKLAPDLPWAKQAAADVASLVEAKEKARREERFVSRSLDPVDRDWRARRARSFAGDRNSMTPKSVLTESQACRMLLVEKLVAEAESFQKYSLENFREWYQKKPPELTRSEVSGAEKQRVDEISALIRKLGFAIAQLRSVRANLAEGESKKFDVPELADLEADNTERFIQKHQRWLKDNARRDREVSANSQKVDSLRTQQSERYQQLIEAAKTLQRVVSEQLSSDDAFPCSFELDVVRRAGSMAATQFVNGLRKDKEAAAKRASEEEARRKKARKEEEERRRKRRRSSW